MLYADRNQQGEITAIRNSPEHSGEEPVNDDELISFIAKSGDIASYQTALTLLDTRIVRVLDDLIDVLIQKNVIRFTDLPEEAQKKIGARKKSARRCEMICSLW